VRADVVVSPVKINRLMTENQHVGGRQWVGILSICLAASLPFVFLYLVNKRSIINEVRNHVMGVAIATSVGINADDLTEIIDEDSMQKPAYRRIQNFLDRIGLANPDIRYIYTMRKSTDPLSPAWMAEFVVDQPARDYDRDGHIDRSEMSELPGASYDASDIPELLNGFHVPSADREVRPDPPYPDLISGYAPIKKPDGEVIGIIGVDITAQTIRGKLLVMQVVMTIVWLVICALISCVFLLYQKQKSAFERISKLSHELAMRNELLRAANQELARMNQRFEADLHLAQRVQQGFLPTRFPRHDRIVFDQYYLTCEILGGDLYDAFEIDQDHVGIYMADVAGHGVSAALVSGLLKMAVATMRQQKPAATASMFIDLTKPDQFLKSVNDLLANEIPEGEFITLIYCVFDLLNNKLIMASAGHPRPIIYHGKLKKADWCETKNGMALGIEGNQQYRCTEHSIDSGDLVLFYTDGLTEAMNDNREEFGDDRLLSLVNMNDVNNASQLNDVIKQAVEFHRSGCEVSDDFTLLTVEVK